MKLHDLKPAPGSKKARRRVGRGIAGKGGKTAGRVDGRDRRLVLLFRATWEKMHNAVGHVLLLSLSSLWEPSQATISRCGRTGYAGHRSERRRLVASRTPTGVLPDPQSSV